MEKNLNFQAWEEGTISTPSEEELKDTNGQIFDIERFLEAYVNYYNNNDNDGLRQIVPRVARARIVQKVQIEEGANE